MKLRSFAAVTTAAFLIAPAAFVAVEVAEHPPAATAAAPETGLALLANQNASARCSVNKTTAYDDHVVVANATTGDFSQDLGKPSGITGRLTDAKPFARNNMVVAVWGRVATGDTGGVGVYDFAATPPRWTTSFELPTDFGTGAGHAHSVAVLPGNAQSPISFVVAQTGSIAGAGRGWLAVFDSAGTKRSQVALTGVHTVEWDGKDGVLYAIGDEHIAMYHYNAAGFTLDPRDSWQVPIGPSGKRLGHEIRRRRTDHKFLVTSNDQAFIFDPVARSFTEVKRNNASIVGGKALDQRWDGKVAVTYWPVDDFFFLDGGFASGKFCMIPYRVRWLYARDTPVFDEDEATPPSSPPASSPADAEPFLWERNFVSAGTAVAPASKEVWAGKAAGDTGDAGATSAANKVTKAIGTDPARPVIPYVLFYQWGDSGTPKMENVKTASPDQLELWVTYAREMAKRVGPTRKAYFVIEPEWDNNPSAMCWLPYRQTLERVIKAFQDNAPNAILLNGVGLWGSDSNYKCFKASSYGTYTHGTTTYNINSGPLNLHKLFDGHGSVLHILSGNTSNPDCTKKSDDTHYRDPNQAFLSKEAAHTMISNLGTTGKLGRIGRLFGTANTYITDLMVTRCGWVPGNQAASNQEQANLVADIVSRLTGWYANNGLRGVAFREGGPGESERFTGILNEGMVNYYCNTPDPNCKTDQRIHPYPAAAEVTNGVTVMQSYLDSIAGSAVDPEFTSEVDAPSSVAAGSGASFVVAVTNTKGSLADANIDFEIYDSANNRLPNGQGIWPEDFANGETVRNTFNWTGTTTPGTYRMKVGVFNSAWQNKYWDEDAGTFTVVANQPAFTSSVSASPSTVAPGGTTTLTATVVNTGTAPLTNGVIDVSVISPSGAKLDTQGFENQTIAAGGTVTLPPWSYTTPPTGGTYTVAVTVHGTGRTPQYAADDDAGTFTVSSSRFTSSATVSRETVMPSTSVTVTATFTNTGSDPLTNGIIDLELYDSSGDRVTGAGGQKFWTGQSLAVGQQSAPYTWTLTAPATADTYTVKAGVFTSTWQNLHWNGKAAALIVAAPSFALSATAEPSQIAPGGPVAINVAVTNSGGAVENGIVDAEVYDAAGNRVPGAQKFWTGQTLTAGVTNTYTWNWTAPSTLGTYTMRLGVFSANWTTQYAWTNNAGQLVVVKPAFTSVASVSSATVAAGGTVTITAAFTNVGGSMPNGIADIEVYNAAGIRVPAPGGQKFWSNVAIRNGETSEFTWAWPAPATPGTYTVKLGVFDPVWTSPAWHWKNSAATISVGAGATFQPSFRVGDNANPWWIEVYTSDDVTGMDVIGGNGRFYLPLTKRAWGAWAGTAPSELVQSDLVQFVARRSTDGSSAASANFVWLSTQGPATTPGWPCTFSIGAGATTSRVEVNVATNAVAVEVKVGTGAFTALTKETTTRWAKAMSVSTGSKVIFRAKRVDNAWAYSTIYNWLQ